MKFNLLTADLLEQYIIRVEFSPLESLSNIEKPQLPVDYFQFYKSVSSVYSSKIEGDDIEFDSYFKHKFLKVSFKADYTKKADDLYLAYDFIEGKLLNFENVCAAHCLITANLLSKSEQGKVRSNPMFVISGDDKIEYVAATPEIVKKETEKLFDDIKILMDSNLNEYEIFYFAALIHLKFLKIHPFQDGNGRTARLMEKWFLMNKIGEKAAAVQLEKNYYTHLNEYYNNIKKIGWDYENLDYSKSLDFLFMTINSIKNP